jgi:tetratricopeptide (TPR) repeat protein
MKLPVASLLIAAAALLPVSTAMAAGGGGGGTPESALDPQYAQAVAQIKAEQYPAAIKSLESYVARIKTDASAENWLGFAYRKTGQLEPAFVHYEKALKIDPNHRGAHEYIGEAYLMAGKLDKAEEHLKVLNRLCWVSCEELEDLKAAVVAYKSKSGGVKTGQTKP